MTSAMICDHASETAPPPANSSSSKRCSAKSSTAGSTQRMLKATPSRMARTMCARVLCSERLRKPPRAMGSLSGACAPVSHGRNSSPALPGGTLSTAASTPANGSAAAWSASASLAKATLRRK